jgi:hypothetical protein
MHRALHNGISLSLSLSLSLSHTHTNTHTHRKHKVGDHTTCLYMRTLRWVVDTRQKNAHSQAFSCCTSDTALQNRARNALKIINYLMRHLHKRPRLQAFCKASSMFRQTKRFLRAHLPEANCEVKTTEKNCLFHAMLMHAAVPEIPFIIFLNECTYHEPLPARVL